MLGQYSRDLPYYLLAKGSAVLSWVFIVWFLTHNLTPEEYGDYALLFSLMTMMTIVTTSWLNSSIFRHLPEFAEANDLRTFQAIIFRLTVLTIVLGLAGFGVVLGIMVFAGVIKAIPESLVSVMVAFAANCAFALVISYLSAKRSLRSFAAASAGQVALFAMGVWVTLGHFDSKTAVIFTVLTLSYLPTVLLAGRGTAKHPIPIAVKAREFMRYGLPLMLMSSATLVNMYSDQFLIRVFTSSTEVGLYSANYLFAERSVLSLSGVLTAAYLPILFRTWESGQRDQAYRFIWHMVVLLVVVLLPIVLLLFVLGDWIAGIFIDPAFASASSIIPIVGLATMVSALAGIFADVMTMQKRTLTLAACYGAAAMLNVALNLYFIPVYGYLAAAPATLASSVFLLLLTFALGQRYAGLTRHFSLRVNAIKG